MPSDASPRLGQYTAQDLLHLVKVPLLADQRWRQLDDRIAAIVCSAIEAGLEQCLGQEAAQQPLRLVVVEGLFGGLVLHQFDAEEEAVPTDVPDDGQVKQLLEGRPECRRVGGDVL